DNSFNLYLLSNPDFFIVGFENLLCRTKEKYRSNNNVYQKAINNVVDLVCESTVNVSLNHGKEDILSKLIIHLAKRNISSYSTPNSTDMNCFSKLLTFADGGELVRVLRSTLNEVKCAKIENINDRYQIFILFKLLECCDDKLFKSDYSELRNEIESFIAVHYKKLFDFSLKNESSVLDADTFYDELYWSGINSKGTIEQFITLMPNSDELFATYLIGNESNRIQVSQAIGNYVQVLNNILPLPEANKSKISKLLRNLIV
uniref:hypothetical protein n=1 Tax=Vibrio harveyi TaxID=669 RepID=UPI000AF8CAFC